MEGVTKSGWRLAKLDGKWLPVVYFDHEVANRAARDKLKIGIPCQVAPCDVQILDDQSGRCNNSLVWLVWRNEEEDTKARALISLTPKQKAALGIKIVYPWDITAPAKEKE
jgi:hypothetical protein